MRPSTRWSIPLVVEMWYRYDLRMAEIRLESVTKSFEGGVTAVDDVSLTIADGEFLALVGPSGCGKSSLLRAIAGLEEVTSGSISIGGRDVTDLAPRSRDIAMVFQSYALYPHMSVRQNLGYGLKVRRTPKVDTARRVEEVAKMLGLDELLERRPAQLSGGQRQRVAMGRAIARQPQAFLMDEPLSNLDAKLRVDMRASLAQLHQQLGTTTVYVTHDQVEAMTLGQRVAVMRDGKVLQIDAPQRLYKEPHNLFVAGFIGSPSMNLLEATVEDGEVLAGALRIPLDGERSPHSAGARKLALGIRPEAFEDAAFAPTGLPSFDVDVAVVEELGSDAYVFFHSEAKRVRPELLHLDDDPTLVDIGTLVCARVDPQTSARVGDRLRLAVDPRRFHFFDLASGASLLGAPDRKEPEVETGAVRVD
jgi:multiple sugar transport system ATP-binding protein